VQTPKHALCPTVQLVALFSVLLPELSQATVICAASIQRTLKYFGRLDMRLVPIGIVTINSLCHGKDQIRLGRCANQKHVLHAIVGHLNE